jgi:glycosyltransferase involved in cell wall biosynthesis
MNVVVLGRFPPPVDGQTVATRRVAELLRENHTVHEINTEPEDTAFVAATVRLRPRRVLHYVRLKSAIRRRLEGLDSAPVVWTSISSVPLGHVRDVTTVLPTLRRDQPCLGVVHRATFHRLFLSPLTRMTAMALVRRVAGLVFLDDGLARQCEPWVPAEKRFVIPNTIDAALCCSDAEADSRQRSPGAPFRLLFLSNMLAEKGFMQVLEALKMLEQRGRPARADFVGRWVAEQDQLSFERYVQANGLGSRVKHHGGIEERATIKQLYLDADAFVLPTFHPTEAQPLTLLEAMNAGTPVITTRQGGIPALVGDDGNASFVPSRDPAAIADAVQWLEVPSNWKIKSMAGRKRFLSAFGPALVGRKWEALIAQALR